MGSLPVGGHWAETEWPSRAPGAHFPGLCDLIRVGVGQGAETRGPLSHRSRCSVVSFDYAAGPLLRRWRSPRGSEREEPR